MNQVKLIMIPIILVTVGGCRELVTRVRCSDSFDLRLRNGQFHLHFMDKTIYNQSHKLWKSQCGLQMFSYELSQCLETFKIVYTYISEFKLLLKKLNLAALGGYFSIATTG